MYLVPYGLRRPFTQENVNPFYLKSLTGNIRVCQGCRGSLRAVDGSVPQPPYNVVIACREQRPFRDPTGILKTPSRPSAAHYHARLACIHAADPKFVSNSLVVPGDVAAILTPQHHELLRFEFGLQASKSY